MIQQYTDLEYKILELISTTTDIKMLSGRLNLSGPPGGYIGQLPQSKVSFDLAEDDSAVVPGSGTSLIHNLNRIRSGLVVRPIYTPDSYTVSNSGNLNDHLEGIDNAFGIIKDCSFSVFRSAFDTDVTGNGTTYTITFDTEVFDTGGNYNPGTGRFTAPTTGKYLLGASVCLEGILSGHNYSLIAITTSKRDYSANFLDPYAVVSDRVGLQTTAFADMDAGDIASVVVMVSGGTNVVDVYGHSTVPRTRFWGVRLI